MRKILTIGLALIIAYLPSCKKNSFDPGTTKTPKSSNWWWVSISVNGSGSLGTAFISTYNTSADNTDSMWVDDLQEIYGFKCKVQLDYNALTFDTKGSDNYYYDPTDPTSFPASVQITDGKILPKAGHSKSGVITDSIYMQVVFSDDPTDTFTLSGTARTGFIEDDY